MAYNPWIGTSEAPNPVRRMAFGDMIGAMGNSLLQNQDGSWGGLSRGLAGMFGAGKQAYDTRFLREEELERNRRKDDIDYEQEKQQLTRQTRENEEAARKESERQRTIETSTEAFKMTASEISSMIQSKVKSGEIPETIAADSISKIKLAEKRLLEAPDEDSVEAALSTLKEVGQVALIPDLDKWATRRTVENRAYVAGWRKIGPDGMETDEPDADGFLDEEADKTAFEARMRKLDERYKQAAIDNIYADNARSDENKDKPPTAAELNKEYSSLLDALATVRDPSVMGVSEGEGGVGMFFDPTITPEVMKASMILGLGDKRRKLSMEEISKLNKLGKDQNFLRQMAIDRATAIKRQGIPPSLFGSSDEIVDNVGAPAAVEDDGIFSDSEIRQALAAPGVTIDDIEEEMRLKGVPEEEILRKLAPYRTR